MDKFKKLDPSSLFLHRDFSDIDMYTNMIYKANWPPNLLILEYSVKTKNNICTENSMLIVQSTMHYEATNYRLQIE